MAVYYDMYNKGISKMSQTLRRGNQGRFQRGSGAWTESYVRRQKGILGQEKGKDKKKEGKRYKQEIDRGNVKSQGAYDDTFKITVINSYQTGKSRKLDNAKCFWDAEDVDIGAAIL